MSSANDDEPGAAVRVQMPAIYAIKGKIAGNTVHQLLRPSMIEEVGPLVVRTRRATSFYLVRADGSRIAITSRRAAPNTSDTLYAANIQAFFERREDFVDLRWLSPAAARPDCNLSVVEVQASDAASASWEGHFEFKEERREDGAVVVVGLRPPQIGALYGILAHWKTSAAPATVVMPTGTGKTETMLAILVRERLGRLLVVVPTNHLRDQIGEKFTTLGLLKTLGVLHPDAFYPVVGLLTRKPKTRQEVDAVFTRCNVIVTTMAIAGQCTEPVQQRIAQFCTHLFIDEAHHVSARTWYALRKCFEDRAIVQFTATPFRYDGKLVDGKVVFNYPLRKAQAEGYFKTIRFKPVDEFDTNEADRTIAEAALGQLSEDRQAGHAHLVMARCADIKRAKQVHAIYAQLAPWASPILLHNEIAAPDRHEAIVRLRVGRSWVVVCVDMLGEGFDLPELKIAAIHDPHKSLAVTLQFTGRFTRTRDDLGDATMIANIANPKVEDALRDLYAEDADWNVILRDLSEGANTRHAKRSEFLDAFQNLPETVSLRNISPKMSAVVYRTGTTRWRPEMGEAAMGRIDIHAGPAVNERDKVLLFVTREHESVAWGDVRDIRNTEWHLYLVHWNEAQGLLFINSSNNGSLHEGLAKAVAGDDVSIIRGEEVFRSLDGISRLVLINLGLSDLINLKLRFSLHVGADISDVLPDAVRMNKRKSNLFARGFENGGRVSMGCSLKGRVWSMRIATDISEWIEWCAAVGAKLLDNAISTAAIFHNVVLPRRVDDRPALVPLLIEWPESFLLRAEEAVEVEIAGQRSSLLDAELRILDFTASGPIRFQIATQSASADYKVRFGAGGVTYESDGSIRADIIIGRKRRTLGEWFREDPPPIRFENGSYLELDEFFELPTGVARRPFDPSRIDVWDWSGVDLSKESQRLEKRADSIQRRVIETILADSTRRKLTVVFDDDGTGEAADIVSLGIDGDRLLIDLHHCKYSSEANPGSRLGDLYEVCGQAQRSVHWRSDVGSLFRHLRGREQGRRTALGPNHFTRFERGDLVRLREVMKAAPRLVPQLRIFIVQPGLSRAIIGPRQLELLAATESYLMDTSAVPLRIIASA